MYSLSRSHIASSHPPSWEKLEVRRASCPSAQSRPKESCSSSAPSTYPGRAPVAKAAAARAATATDVSVTWFGVSPSRPASQARYFDHGEIANVVYGESSDLTAWSSRARSDAESVTGRPVVARARATTVRPSVRRAARRTARARARERRGHPANRTKLPLADASR